MLRATLGLLSLVSLAVCAPSSQAQLFPLQTPRVSVTVGPSLLPSVAIASPAQVPMAPPPPVAEPTLPPPRVLPGGLMPRADMVPAAPVVLRPMTHYEFAACFKPGPGCHEALLIHPGSGCPVLVRFTLPPGCPKVCVARRDLIFDYGCNEVAVRFKIFGKVGVSYH